ncbi:MAG: pyrimidine-nucleoside phosphorylase, partial [Acetatifactor sp.]|nr:pyrimidine-nucleoside phosphorylase [Acetatifactor sp.]MDE7113014.1 pyrimidine-nucleoside phosphorylase [Acetatifactor sp.]
GGDSAAVYEPERLPKAHILRAVPAPRDGYVQHIACDEVGVCSLILGGGRETKESELDLAVGLVLEKKVGDFVKAGEPLAYLHGNDEDKCQAAEKRFLQAYVIDDERPDRSGYKIIKEII